MDSLSLTLIFIPCFPCRWLRLCLLARVKASIPAALDMVNVQGRMKFTRPLYRYLFLNRYITPKLFDGQCFSQLQLRNRYVNTIKFVDSVSTKVLVDMGSFHVLELFFQHKSFYFTSLTIRTSSMAKHMIYFSQFYFHWVAQKS